MGLAVAGILPEDSRVKPLVVKFELYETSSPPGNRGGAVSGAAPCALAEGTQSNVANDSTHCPRKMRKEALSLTMIPSVQNDSEHTYAWRSGWGRLDTKGCGVGCTRDWRSVGLVFDELCPRCDVWRYAEWLDYSTNDGGEHMVRPYGLADVTCCWHCLAAVLAVTMMRHALHRLAALHRLVSFRHWSAVECITDERNREHYRED